MPDFPDETRSGGVARLRPRPRVGLLHRAAPEGAGGPLRPAGLLFFDLDGVRLLLDREAPASLLYLHVDNVHETLERLDGLIGCRLPAARDLHARGRHSRPGRSRGVAGLHPRLRGQHGRADRVPVALTASLRVTRAEFARAIRCGRTTGTLASSANLIAVEPTGLNFQNTSGWPPDHDRRRRNHGNVRPVP